MRIGYRTRAIGLLAALALSLGMVAPTLAQGSGTVNVTVEVDDAGLGQTSFSIAEGSNANFANVNVDAIGTSDGVTPTNQNLTFVVAITGDDKLLRPGGEINIKLGDGDPENAFLDLTTPDTPPAGFTADPSKIDFQIPGRYLKIAGMNNPQQAKYTGGTGSSGPIWNGANPPDAAGRAPRVAGGGSGEDASGKAIYRVGDIGGTFDGAVPGDGECDVTMGSDVEAWPSACPDSSFGENANITKQIAYIYAGSGFVEAEHTIELSLVIPAGAYPGVYTGTLTLEWVAS